MVLVSINLVLGSCSKPQIGRMHIAPAVPTYMAIQLCSIGFESTLSLVWVSPQVTCCWFVRSPEEACSSALARQKLLLTHELSLRGEW